MRHVARVLIALLLFLLTAEAAVRVARPTPRAQIVREDTGAALRVDDGVVMWSGFGPQLTRDSCLSAPEDAVHAVFVGSSILRGSGVQAHEVLSEVLRTRLPADQYCVDNLAESGFTGEQKRVSALEALARPRPPDVLYWEVWENDFGHYVLYPGGVAINIYGFVEDEAGYPAVPWVPAPVHHALFGASEAWRYAVLALAPGRSDGGSMHDLRLVEVQRDLEPVLARAAAVGTTVVLVVCPTLDRPFVESLAHPHLGYGPIWSLARDRGLRLIRLDQVLEHEDVIAMRADPCCHYSPAGHQRLAAAFEADLLTIRAQRDNRTLSE